MQLLVCMSCHAMRGPPLEGYHERLTGSCVEWGEVTDSLTERSAAGSSSLPDVWLRLIVSLSYPPPPPPPPLLFFVPRLMSHMCTLLMASPFPLQFKYVCHSLMDNDVSRGSGRRQMNTVWLFNLSRNLWSFSNRAISSLAVLMHCPKL